MTTDLAQAMAMVSRGNGILAGYRYQTPLEETMLFEYANGIDFRSGYEEVVFPGFEEFMESMKLDGAVGFRLFIQAEDEPGDSVNLIAFQNNSIFNIEIIRESGLLRRRSRLIGCLITQDDPPNRLSICLFEAGPKDHGLKSTLAQAREELGASLQEIEAYAQEQGRTEFVRIFRQALQSLEQTRGFGRLGEVLLPPNASLEARQLGEALMSGWVFGGMGSWNDWCGDERYDAVTNRYYLATMRAAVAAVEP